VRLRAVRRLSIATIGAATALAAIVLVGCGASNVVDPVARAATVSNQAPGMRVADLSGGLGTSTNSGGSPAGG